MTNNTSTQPFIPPHRRVATPGTHSATIQLQKPHLLGPHHKKNVPGPHVKASIPVSLAPTQEVPDPQTMAHVSSQDKPAHPRSTRPRKRSSPWIKGSDLKSGSWMKGTAKHNQHDTLLKAGAASGWDNATSQGQTATEYSLVNYDGNWAPAPENWDSRPAFRDHQSTANIDTWRANIQVEPRPLESISRDKDTTNFYQDIPDLDGSLKRYHFACSSGSDHAMGDIVPQYWKFTDIENQSLLSAFWQEHLKAPPTPCDESDLTDFIPWWDSYLSHTACFQLPLHQPEHRGISVSDESPQDKQMREMDRGSQNAVERLQFKYKSRRDRARPGNKEAKEKSDRCSNQDPQKWVVATPEEPAYDHVPDTSIVPKASISVRRAQPGDISQITDIYNHYVENSMRVPECSPILPNHMLDRLRSINRVGHLFIIACLPGGSTGKGAAKTPGNRSKTLAVPNTDHVVGVAYSDDFNSPSSMYRFVAEVEIYTHPDFTRKHIASCLLDKLVSIFDPSYISRGGYEVSDDELGLAGQRLVGCLWINFPYVPDDGEKEWATKWLEAIGFEQSGDHKQVAVKNGKSANLAVFTRQTGCLINPKSPPIGRKF